ncbi:MAG: hypothetical protein IIT41_04015, partial [Oscillospiraceae bacterium]|nr:hypothetical protein [Oscillospiraceae bacterium]
MLPCRLFQYHRLSEALHSAAEDLDLSSADKLLIYSIVKRYGNEGGLSVYREDSGELLTVAAVLADGAKQVSGGASTLSAGLNTLSANSSQ